MLTRPLCGIVWHFGKATVRLSVYSVVFCILRLCLPSLWWSELMIDVIYKGGQNVEWRLLRVFEKDRLGKEERYHTKSVRTETFLVTRIDLSPRAMHLLSLSCYVCKLLTLPVKDRWKILDRWEITIDNGNRRRLRVQHERSDRPWRIRRGLQR